MFKSFQTLNNWIT